jgi:hypothetical protein
MIRIQRLASAVSLAFLFTSLSSNAQDLIAGQIYNTGNVVLPTNQGGPSSWVNGVYQNNLTCWSWGQPGYCGPDAIVGPGNNINFSFGSTYLYQQQDISSILPSSTPGLQVTGYNFGFRAKNGNGWDDGRVDQLAALVRFWDTTGGRGTSNLLYGNSYDLNYKFNWTNFNFSENFTSPLNASSIGKVQYGFIGRDNNGWAGPYGPEVTNVSFSLKYTVDPCSVNVLSSPTCPGYLSAINSLTPATVAASSTIVSTPTTVATLPTTSDVQPSTITVDAGGVEVSTSGTISAPDNIPQSVKESAQKTESEKQEEKTKSGPNMSLIMSVVRQVQANDRATQAAAVENALQEVSSAIANAQDQTNMVIENNQRNNAAQQQAAAESQQTSVVSVQLQNAQTSRQSSFNFEPVAAVNQIQQIQKPVEQVNTQTQVQVSKVDYSLLPLTVQPFTSSQVSVFRQNENQGEIIAQTNFVSNESPIKSILEQKPFIENTTTEQKTETVKSNVQSNELAGNVDINKMAVTPPGFNAYMSLALKDGQLYKPEEIYKNQVTVDNVRALRQLSSDRVHQEMVNQQYRN